MTNSKDSRLPIKAVPFSPWHRFFVMQFESELRRYGERLGITKDFAMPYWDWAPTDTCLVFTHELLGTPEYSDKVVNVSGTIFEGGNWPVVCDLLYRSFIAFGKEPVTTNTSATECAKERTLCDVEGDRMLNRPSATWPMAGVPVLKFIFLIMRQ